MENQTPTEPIKPAQHKTQRYVFSLIGIVLAVTAVFATYYWQHGQVNSLGSQVASLHAQLMQAAKTQPQQQSKQDEQQTFTYSPKTGGVRVRLPRTYGIIVNVDGNKGGAPGATFRVAKVIDSTTLSDASYQGVQVDVGNTFTTLDNAVSAKETGLTQAKAASNFKVTDTTVAGLPAKMITADGPDEYVGQLAYLASDR
jgi:hypothetical protein